MRGSNMDFTEFKSSILGTVGDRYTLCVLWRLHAPLFCHFMHKVILVFHLPLSSLAFQVVILWLRIWDDVFFIYFLEKRWCIFYFPCFPLYFVLRTWGVFLTSILYIDMQVACWGNWWLEKIAPARDKS